MSREPLDPQQIPDDATAGDLAAYVGEDIGRVVMLRVAALAGVVAVVAGLMSESASSVVKTAAVAVGAVGLVLLLLAQLFGWRRTRQWAVILGVLVTSGALVAAVLLGQSG